MLLAPSNAFLLPPNAIQAPNSGFIPVSVPSGAFSAQKLQLYSYSLDQVVDSVDVTDFSTPQTINLNAISWIFREVRAYGKNFGIASPLSISSPLFNQKDFQC